MKKIMAILMICILFIACSSSVGRLPIKDGEFVITVEEFCERYKKCVSSNDEYEGISLGELTKDGEIFDYEILYQSEKTDTHLAFIKGESKNNVRTIALVASNLKDNEDAKIRNKIMEPFIKSCDDTLSHDELNDILEKIFSSNIETTPEMILENDFPTETTVRNDIIYVGWIQTKPSLTFSIMVNPNE